MDGYNNECKNKRENVGGVLCKKSCSFVFQIMFYYVQQIDYKHTPYYNTRYNMVLLLHKKDTNVIKLIDYAKYKLNDLTLNK